MKTNIYSALLGTSALVLSLLSFRPAAFAQTQVAPIPYAQDQSQYEGDQPVYAVPSVVYEAPVVYQAPVTYQMPVLYMGPVSYVMTPVDPRPVCAPREPTPSTVVVIGGQSGSYSYTTDTLRTPDVVYIGGGSAPRHYTFRGR